jgi:hypothetical protein
MDSPGTWELLRSTHIKELMVPRLERDRALRSLRRTGANEETRCGGGETNFDK